MPSCLLLQARWLLYGVVIDDGILSQNGTGLSAQVEQAEPRQAGGVQQHAIQILFFEHRELICGHFAAIGTKLDVEFSTGSEQVVFGLARAGYGDHFVFERREPALQILQIVVEIGAAAYQFL